LRNELKRRLIIVA